MTSLSPHWATPKWLYAYLDKEFTFDYDPCPLGSVVNPNLLVNKWGKRNYINPPYGRLIGDWIKRSWYESQHDKICVMLLPCRTDTKWWHDYVMLAQEIRFIKGRLKFNDCKNSAPFPSCIAIFKGDKCQLKQ